MNEERKRRAITSAKCLMTTSTFIQESIERDDESTVRRIQLALSNMQDWIDNLHNYCTELEMNRD